MAKDRISEEKRLEDTIIFLRGEITRLKASVEKKREEIIIQKQNMREEVKHSMPANLNSADGFMQLVELSQFAAQTNEAIDNMALDEKKIGQYTKILDAPYFARIDFAFADDGEREQVYIGRLSVMDDNTYAQIIYDWRSPIAGMFYQFGPGPASYEAPVGRIQGEILLKRQYEIKKGLLAYYFDTDIQILDEYLAKMLSGNASPKMKSIVETIQKDQDRIIRNLETDLLMVQGVAGSGKTAVALHRIAYLLYHGLTKKLTSQNVVIISPNTLFERYIAHVLPELGEENILSLLFDEIYEDLLRRPFQGKNKLYETLIEKAEKPWMATMKKSLGIKMSSSFVRLLDTLPLKEGASKEQIFAAYKNLFHMEIAIGHWEEVSAFTRENLKTRSLFYDDASALCYLCLKFGPPTAYRHIKQVVIDEVQDYYPIHFEMLRLLFPAAKFTVLGDINQTIAKTETLDFYDNIQTILGKGPASFTLMDKSFRCAHEILAFSKQFSSTDIKSFSRHCTPPQIIQRQHPGDYDGLLREIQEFRDSDRQSMGILCKTEGEAKRLYEAISGKTEIRLVQGESTEDLTGVLILPVYLAKGLEFDHVVLWEVSSTLYHTAEDRQLLYIASTRALHRLNLFYSGSPSPLLAQGQG